MVIGTIQVFAELIEVQLYMLMWPSPAVWSIQAHREGTAGYSYNLYLPGWVTCKTFFIELVVDS